MYPYDTKHEADSEVHACRHIGINTDGTNPDSETKSPDSETENSLLGKLETTASETKNTPTRKPKVLDSERKLKKIDSETQIPDLETKTPDSETKIPDAEIKLKLPLLKSWRMEGGVLGGGGWGGGGGVISCIPNQGVMVYESGFLVSDARSWVFRISC